MVSAAVKVGMVADWNGKAVFKVRGEGVRTWLGRGEERRFKRCNSPCPFAFDEWS